MTLIFDRESYLDSAEGFEQNEITTFDEELCEFNSDPEDLASELAYTRYHLAKTEEHLETMQRVMYTIMHALEEYQLYSHCNMED